MTPRHDISKLGKSIESINSKVNTQEAARIRECDHWEVQHNNRIQSINLDNQQQLQDIASSLVTQKKEDQVTVTTLLRNMINERQAIFHQNKNDSLHALLPKLNSSPSPARKKQYSPPMTAQSKRSHTATTWTNIAITHQQAPNQALITHLQ
jgi:DNA-binding protein H-NS